MRKVRVHYIFEPEGWSAESPDRPQWAAWGESLDEVRDLAREGLPLVFDEPLALVEYFPPTVGTIVPRLSFSGVRPSEFSRPFSSEPDVVLT